MPETPADAAPAAPPDSVPHEAADAPAADTSAVREAALPGPRGRRHEGDTAVPGTPADAAPAAPPDSVPHEAADTPAADAPAVDAPAADGSGVREPVADKSGLPGPRGRRRSVPPLPQTQRRSWFRVGFGAGLGAILAWLLVQTVLQISELLTLFLLAFFIAVSLEPLVGRLCRLGLRRAWSVAVVLVGFAGVLAGFLALVIPPVSTAVTSLSDAVPRWRTELHDHHSMLGRLEDRYHVIEKAQEQLGSGGGASKVAGGVLGAGQLVLSTVTSTVIVVTVALYVMAGLPAIKRFCYRFVPGTRRERVEVVSEEILSRVGRYMLGNVATSAIAGLATFIWCAAIGVPYPAALGVFVALMDMIPVVGSTVGGIVVSLVALSVSLPVAVATAVFYVAFRLAEDYLIMPRAMKFAVDVHPVVTVVAVLAGGSLLGIIGGLVAIPVAVAIGIVLDEYVFPKTDAA